MAYQPRRGLFSQLIPQNQLKIGESPNKKLSFSSLSKNKQRHQEWASTQIVSPSVKSTNMLHSQVREIQSPTCLTFQNKQNVSDEYRLFSNLLKNQINKQSNQKIGISKNNLSPSAQKYLKRQDKQIYLDDHTRSNANPSINSDYYGANFQMKDRKGEKEKESRLGVRPESRHKVQKYFQDNPVIRPKSSSKQNDNKFNCQKISNSNNVKNQTRLQISQSQDKEKKTSINYHTFPPNQYYNNQKYVNVKRNFESTQTQGDDNVNTSTSSLKFDMSPFF